MPGLVSAALILVIGLALAFLFSERGSGRSGSPRPSRRRPSWATAAMPRTNWHDSVTVIVAT
ncbi:MAG: hypothetical protein HS102_19690 [Planctomycetia bacterium]|nr:hypothetical protein [Planctomycetia bacterium]MCQ3921933.1 hypothetical protein [Planctomycetota bacterium]NUQ10445.1 hypothetical protein [Phycisphaerae bacterium]